jgi:hypothetical protein
MLNVRNNYPERKGNDTTGEEEGRKKENKMTGEGNIEETRGK